MVECSWLSRCGLRAMGSGLRVTIGLSACDGGGSSSGLRLIVLKGTAR